MDSELMKYLSAFLEPFLVIVLPILATFLAGLVVQQIRLVQEKIKNERPDIYGILAFLTEAAVKSAEQAKIAELIDDKKAYAIQFVQDRLATYGIKMDVSLIAAEIEKAVFESINQPKELMG